MTDRAYVLFQSWTYERRATNLPAYGSWEEFVIELTRTFSPINDLQRARDHLAQLRQDSTVATYISDFHSLTMLVSDLSVAEALNRFKERLKREMLMAVELQGFSTTEMCQRLADRVDTITDILRSAHRLPPHPQPRFSPVDAYPVPMELGAVALPRTPLCLPRTNRCNPIRQLSHHVLPIDIISAICRFVRVIKIIIGELLI